MGIRGEVSGMCVGGQEKIETCRHRELQDRNGVVDHCEDRRIKMRSRSQEDPRGHHKIGGSGRRDLAELVVEGQNWSCQECTGTWQRRTSGWMSRQRCASGWTKDSDNAPNQSSMSSGNAGEAVSDRNKKVGAEHSKDVERDHEELSVAEGVKRKAGCDEEDQEARRGKTVRFQMKIQRGEKQDAVSRTMQVAGNEQEAETDDADQRDS